MIVGFRLQILQRQVLQLALQLIQPQLVGQGCVEIAGLDGHALLRLVVGRVLDLPHHVQSAHDDDEDDADVLGKGHQQGAEILGLYGGRPQVEALYLAQPVQNLRHVRAEVPLDVFPGACPAQGHGAEHDGQDGRAAQPYLFAHDDGRLQVEHNGMQAKLVAPQVAFRGGTVQILAHHVGVLGAQRLAGRVHEAAIQFHHQLFFFGAKEAVLFHHRTFLGSLYNIIRCKGREKMREMEKPLIIEIAASK